MKNYQAMKKLTLLRQWRSMMQKRIFILIVLVLFCGVMTAPDTSHAQITYTVTNANDEGPGSLRAGLYDPAPTILFAIPETDPGYDPLNRVWVIKAASPYHVPAGKIIDGRAAREGGGMRPSIEMDGTLLGLVGSTGFYLNEGVVVRGLIVHSCGYAIWVSQSNVTISDCYIGTDASGTVARPNSVDGVLFIHGAQNSSVENSLISGNGSSGIRISGSATVFITVFNNRIGTNADGSAAIPNTSHGVSIHANAKSNFIEGNLISGNLFSGILISGDSTSSNSIRGNKIGTNRDGDAALGNGSGGIRIDGGSKHNLVEENLVSGNTMVGIHLMDAGTNFNLIRHNRVGTDITATAAIPNTQYGVALFNGPCNNVIGPENVIAFNSRYGILVDGGGSMIGTIGNTFTLNSIYANVAEGIKNYRGGNAELVPPVLTQISATQISGTTVPGQLVEVFTDENGQGKVYLGTAHADLSGYFALDLAVPPAMPWITATTADYMGNTSAFSIPLATGIKPGASTGDLPRHYHLSQNYPNPFNPVTTLQYELPRAGEVWLTVYDRTGRRVRSLVDGQQQAGVYRILWNGSDDNGGPVAAGLYICQMRAGTFHQRIKLVLVR